jgi:4-diphosphocytidyl-2C-methyl-D-erythritol kinase
MRARGKGELLTPMQAPKMDIVIAKPELGLPTSRCFAAST